MFPPETPSHSHLLRSKRGRQTLGSDDSVKLPATKKRRSALRRDTFEPLSESSVNELAGRAHKEGQSNGALVEPSSKPPRSASQSRELTLRGGKKTEKRSERGSGLLTLSTNEFYTISQLPALPEQIRSRPTVPYSCVISPENECILALTHTDALVWSYNVSTSNPTSRELLSFKLPYPSAVSDDPLPLAAFTNKSANGEPGIVVVAPKLGNIVYWETLSSASSYSATQTSSGVQGTIPGMIGDTVKELVPAEPAGFIMTLASGRVAQLTVRDQMGRPAIGVQFMRKSVQGSVRGGIFGSIRNVFAADRRKGTAIVRPGKTARAQRDIIVCTDDAELEFWTNNLVTGNQLTSTVNIKQHLLAGLEPYVGADKLDHPLQFKVVDFGIPTTPASTELVRRDDTDSASLLLLVAISDPLQSKYYLVETTVAGDDAQVRVVHPITCYSDEITNNQSWRPKICIPASSTTALVLFERAVVIMSLARIAESLALQMSRDNNAVPKLFQDCVRFKDKSPYCVINFAAEDNEVAPSCVLAVQGFGLARVTSHLPTCDELEVEEVKSQVSAKERIEQAIFFGTKDANPLDLKRSYREAYAPSEIWQGSMWISQEIVSSKSNYLPKSSPAIAEHMQLRARLLQDLVEYVLSTYSDCLARDHRFALLWNAEKLAAAQAVWKVQERIQATYPRNDDRDMTYLNFTLMALSEKRQKYPKPEKGETDHVRHWLIHSVTRTDLMLVELDDVASELSKMNVNDPRVICDYFLEALDIWTTAFKTAFKFREENATIYGLGNEAYQDGVLQSGYPATLPSVWTSNREQLKHARMLVEKVCTFLNDWWDYVPAQQNGSAHPKSKNTKEIPTDVEGQPYGAPSKESLTRIAAFLPEQVELYRRIIIEDNLQQQVRIGSSEMRQEDKDQELARIGAEVQPLVNEAIKMIAPFNRDGAIALAESLEDTDLLVSLNLAYLAELGTEYKAHPDERLKKKIRGVQNHVETYFDRFGNDWAYSHFSNMIERGEVGRLLTEAQSEDGKKQSYASWFFETCARHDKRLGKIAWINNIVGEKKFDAACRTLENVADHQETNIWSKKTEICLAKLAGLAALEAADSNATPPDLQIDGLDIELEYIRIVESLSIQINEALFDAVDDEAAVQLAIERFVPKSIVSSKKSQQTRKRLSTTLFKLVTNENITLPELVDALTLLDLDPLRNQETDAELDDIADAEFPYALSAIDLAPAKEADARLKDHLRKTVWRRLLIRDDWVKINDTAGKSDEQVKVIMQNTTLFMTILDLIRKADRDKVEAYIPSIDEIMQYGASNDAKGDDGKLAEEAKTEYAILSKFVERARLKDHFGGLIKEAKDELRRFQDAEGEAAAEEVLASSALEPSAQVNGAMNGVHA